MSLLLRFTFFLLLGITFSACGPDYIYEKKYEFDKGWSYADSLFFKVSIKDTLSIYNLYLDVNHIDAYPYQNMYVRIHTTFPDQQKLTERVSITMAKKTGEWVGECTSENCRLRINIQEGAFFNQSGEYIFMVEQFMRHDTLSSIKAVALAIEDTGESRGEKQTQ